MNNDKPVLFDPKACPHKKVRIYVEKRDGKYIPGVIRCWDCGDEVKRNIVLVPANDPGAIANIPKGSEIVMGTVSGVRTKP